MDMEKMTNGANPFDAIKKVKDDGRETWSGRELLLDVANYADWTRAKPAIERAVQSMDNIGVSAGEHVRDGVGTYVREQLGYFRRSARKPTGSSIDLPAT